MLVRLGQAAVFIVTCVVVFGCNRTQPKLAPTKPAEVLITSPVLKEVTDFEDLTGRTEAANMVEIRARVTGYLDKAVFKEGADIKQGDLLFEIDPRTYKAELDRAEATVTQVKAHAERLRSDYQRSLTLLSNKAISREDADKIAGDRTEAEAAVGVAMANRELALLNLGFTRITSPISGRISRRLIDPGNLVKADDTPLTTILALDPIYAYFDVDERTLLKIRRLIREGKIKSSRETEINVQIGLADEEGYSTTGTINFVENRVDPGTGTLRVRAIVANPNLLLSPGLFVRIRLPVGVPHQAIQVPEESLGTDQGQKFVYIVNEKNEVVARKVKTGLLQNGWRVIESGVKPNDRIIVSGLQRVRPGVKVDPKPAESASQSSPQGTAPVAGR